MCKAKVYIGISGFSYSHWRGIFYPENLPSTKRFEFYTNYFQTTEINSSFYRLPQEKTILNWYISSPDNFVFSLKAPKVITHLKRFLEVEEEWNKFENRIKLLNEKLGPVLLQLPPSFKADDENIKRLSERCIVLCLIHKLSPNIYLLYIQILIHQYKICSKAFFYRAALKRKKT